MPFEKGNKLAVGNKGGGRKGYEYEQEQLGKMRKILNKALTLTEKVMSGKASIKEAMAYENSIRMVLKIMDKLHANKQFIEGEITGNLPFVIKIIKDDGTNKGENSEVLPPTI